MWQDMSVVFADEELVAAAAQAAERLRLRAYEAIQLAAASRSRCDLFLCSDTKLLAAANSSNLAILNLNEVL